MKTKSLYISLILLCALTIGYAWMKYQPTGMTIQENDGMKYDSLSLYIPKDGKSYSGVMTVPIVKPDTLNWVSEHSEIREVGR